MNFDSNESHLNFISVTESSPSIQSKSSFLVSSKPIRKSHVDNAPVYYKFEQSVFQRLSKIHSAKVKKCCCGDSSSCTYQKQNIFFLGTVSIKSLWPKTRFSSLFIVTLNRTGSWEKIWNALQQLMISSRISLFLRWLPRVAPILKGQSLYVLGRETFRYKFQNWSQV